MELNNAFTIHHVNKGTYSGKLNYSPNCIFCLNTKSINLLPDGSFRKCEKCFKHFKATILSKPIQNYNECINIINK